MTISSEQIENVTLSSNYHLYYYIDDTTNPIRSIFNVYPDYHQINVIFDGVLQDTPDNYHWYLFLEDSSGTQSYIIGSATTTTVTFEITDRDSDKFDKAQIWLYDSSTQTSTIVSFVFNLYYRKTVTN